MSVKFPGHALHERSLQRRIGVGSGEKPGTKSGRRPIDKLRLNCGASADFVPPLVYIGSPLFVLPETRSGRLFDCISGHALHRGGRVGGP